MYWATPKQHLKLNSWKIKQNWVEKNESFIKKACITSNKIPCLFRDRYNYGSVYWTMFFFIQHVSYCPFVWMHHRKTLNNKIFFKNFFISNARLKLAKNEVAYKKSVYYIKQNPVPLQIVITTVQCAKKCLFFFIFFFFFFFFFFQITRQLLPICMDGSWKKFK